MYKRDQGEYQGLCVDGFAGVKPTGEQAESPTSLFAVEGSKHPVIGLTQLKPASDPLLHRWRQWQRGAARFTDGAVAITNRHPGKSQQPAIKTFQATFQADPEIRVWIQLFQVVDPVPGAPACFFIRQGLVADPRFHVERHQLQLSRRKLGLESGFDRIYLDRIQRGDGDFYNSARHLFSVPL